ncbi:MAG: ParB/RepB/Spo0J family partition protein [Lachnospiraceae bacterium]|nr:ParB/RepB/Spo0J family partition protein [Lachnospiraceae bacterium]
MEYKPTASSAIEFSSVDNLSEWVHLFLLGEGDNKEFSDGLKLKTRVFHAPKMMSLNNFERCCGPEDNMKYQISEASFRERVKRIASFYHEGNWDMPPLIINHFDDKYELNDGNHRFEALKMLGIDKYWVIVWETPILLCQDHS